MDTVLRKILILMSVALIFACAGESKELPIQKAQGYIAEGQYQEALIELKNALQDSPGDSTARLLLGEMYFHFGKWVEAEKELNLARESGAAEESVIPLLAQVYIAQAKYDDVMAMAPDSLNGTGLAVLSAAKGLAEMGRGRLTEASFFLDEAIRHDSTSPYVLTSSARLLGSTPGERAGTAREQIEKALLIDPDYGPAWTLLGEMEARDKNLDLAEIAFTKAVELNADNKPDLLRRAVVRIEQEKYSEARQDIDQLVKVAPESAAVGYANGLIHFANREYEDALTAFELAAWEEDRYPLALYYSGAIHLALGNDQLSESFARQYHSVAPADSQGSLLLAAVLLKRQDFEAAEALIRPVLFLDEDNAFAMNMLATALMQQGKSEEGIEYFQQVVALEPESATAQTKLGAALMAGGQEDQAIRHIEKSLQLDPQSQDADILLTLSHMKKGDFEAAISAARAYQLRHPDAIAPYILVGRTFIAAGNEDKAVETFRSALNVFPGDPSASHNLALIAMKNREMDEARGYYHEVLANNPNNLMALVKLARLDALEGKDKSMVKYLKSAIEAHPSAVEPRLVLASYYTANGKANQVAITFAGLNEQAQIAPPVLRALASSQIALRQFSDAKLTLKRLIDLHPNTFYAHFELSKAYAGLGDEEGMRSELAKAIELGPRKIAPRLALASLYLQNHQLAEAEQQLAALKEIDQENPDVIHLEVMLANASGNDAKGLVLAQGLYERAPSTLSLLSLVKQTQAIGQSEAAIELLEQWCKENPQDLDASLELAASYRKEKRYAEAASRYEMVLENHPRNLVALNNLAFYMRKTSPEKALQYADLAAQIEPGSPRILHTLAMVQLANGGVDEAQRAIERAIEAEPDNPMMRYHSALIDLAAGDSNAAQRTLSEVVKSDKDFPERDAATELLKELSN